MSTQDKKRFLHEEPLSTEYWATHDKIDAVLDQANNGPRKLFEITAVIGEVYEDPIGQFTPQQVAFLQIESYFKAINSLSNTFTFPSETGLIHMTIDVEPTKTDS